MSKVSTKLTEEEVEERKGERKYGDVDQILGRRKNGRTMEYECTYVGQVFTSTSQSLIGDYCLLIQ